MVQSEKRISVIIYHVHDLFFRAVIEGLCKQLGYSCSMTKDIEELKTTSGIEGALIICDLVSARSDLKAIQEVCLTTESQVLGYYSHVDVETRRDAEAHNIDFIIPKSAFQRKLIELLSKG